MSGAVKLLDRVLFAAIALLLAAMVVDVTIQVFFRYVIQNPPTWTEELARYIFAWEIFLAMGLAFGRGSHILVDALLAALHGVARRGLVIAADLVNLAFMLVLLWQGVNMMVLTSDTTSTAMGLNMGVVYASLPAGAAVSCLYIILRLIAGFRGSEIESQTLLMD